MLSKSLATSADLTVIGSGVAGLAAALAAADAGAKVTILTAGKALAGSSPRAQGGIAAALGSDDSAALHAADTLAVGGGLNDRHAVQVLTSAGERAVRALLAGGVPFDGGPFHPDLGLEAGHQRHRIVHTNGAATGSAVTTALLSRALQHRRIHLQEYAPVDRLLTDGRRVVGATSGSISYLGSAVVLATGGYAGLFGRTTNAQESRGQGLVLAWSVGATLADLEFVQFHPTALALPDRPAFLLSEALRGEGALLVDGDYRPVVDPLLPRDQVARAIFRHANQRGPVYLSLRQLEPQQIRSHFSTLASQLQEWGLHLATDLLPVAPAAHYCMGGVRSDDMGRTDVPGLYVAGEVACTGAQGANRLASNSLLECLVFGRLAAEAALSDAPESHASWNREVLDQQCADPTRYIDGPITMSDSEPATRSNELDVLLGVERRKDTLCQLLGVLRDPLTPQTLVAALATRAALLREESRGAHFRSDFPLTEERWQRRILWQRDAAPTTERTE